MKITMISNYINHHQIPFSEELYRRLGEDYHFIQTEPMEEERIAMGWGIKAEELPYVLFLDQSMEACIELIRESDVLLAGWTQREDLLAQRLAGDRLTLRISERIYREGQWKAISPRGLLRKWNEHIRHRNRPVYLLCAGAYVASDFSLIGAYPGKKYKFGYFPEYKAFSPKELEENHPWGNSPNERELQLVWAGRFLPLKRPEYGIRLAERLKRKGYRFHLHLIGGGELEEELKSQVREKGLEEEVTFYGFLRPSQVREIMEKSHIHLFTSNQLEGWGAVVNEAMNSGCVEVANDRVGAAPFLIQHGKNGLLYRKGSFEDMAARVCYLFEHPKEGQRMSLAAYQTIREQWNAGVAADRLLTFYEQWQAGQILPPGEGPFSVAAKTAP